MLRIIVEPVPGGDDRRRREIARAHIGNVSDLADLSDYAVWAREGENPIANSPAWEGRGSIEGRDRRQTVWRLIERAAAVAAAAARKG
jgi:hypothetical protein